VVVRRVPARGRLAPLVGSVPAVFPSTSLIPLHHCASLPVNMGLAQRNAEVATGEFLCEFDSRSEVVLPQF